MKNSSLILLLVSVLYVNALFADAVLNIYQPIRKTKVTHEQLKDAIVSAADELQWKIEPVGDGLVATYRVSDYMARVRISYAPSFYTIDYLESERLRYDGWSIHPTYNGLVTSLQKAIVRNLKSLQKSSADAAPQAPEEEAIRAKLLTLKQLYEEGLITEDEYSAKRKALLDAF